MKYAKITGAVRWSGGTTVLGAGTSADDDHPLVLERPDLFTDEPPAPQLAGPARLSGRAAAAAEEPPVERATAKPGERRATKKTGGNADA